MKKREFLHKFSKESPKTPIKNQNEKLELKKSVENSTNKIAYSGMIASRTMNEYHNSLERILSDMHLFFAYKWDSLAIKIPISNFYKEGIYQFSVYSLMGTRTPFKQIQVRTNQVMSSERIYWLNNVHSSVTRPVELLPLFKIMEGPKTEQNACYFYNRISGNKVRWVFYHFQEESEILDSNIKGMLKTLEVLRPVED